jgi:hypothetical protein
MKHVPTRGTQRRCRFARLVVVPVVLTAMLAASLPAKGLFLDQEQAEVTSEREVATRRFQTFTAGVSGTLDRVSVYLTTSRGPCDTIVEIRDVVGGAPHATVLATHTISEIHLSEGWNDVWFTTPATVTPHEQYAIAVMSVATCDTHVGNVLWGATAGNPYLGGSADGEPNVDFAFRTYVDPFPTPILGTPDNGSTTTDTTPTFSGTADTRFGGEIPPVTIEIYEGTEVSGTPARTFTADPNDQSGFFTTVLTQPIPPGTYVARVLQTIAAGTGASSPNVFLVDPTGTEPAPAPAPGGASSGAPGTPGAGDTSAPDTTITSESFSRTKDRTPSFSFASDETNVRFECALDGADFAPCGAELTLPKLKRGDHTLLVRAVDQAGNADPSPARAEFKVKRRNKH